MKKIYQIILLCTMAVALVGCTNQEEQREEQCRKAIAENDFALAHQIVDEMKAKHYLSYMRVESDLQESEVKYVITEMGDGSQTAAKVLMLLQDSGDKNLLNKMLTLAVQLSYTEIVTTLTNAELDKIFPENKVNVIKFLEEKNPDAMITIFKNTADNGTEIKAMALAYCEKTRNEELLLDLTNSKHWEMESDTLQRAMAAMNSKECNEQLIAYLSLYEKKVVIHDMPAAGYSAYEYSWVRDELKMYNNVCRDIVDYAILNKNKNLADMAIRKFRKNLQWKHTYKDYPREYYITYDYSDRDAANKALNDAKANGVFN